MCSAQCCSAAVKLLVYSASLPRVHSPRDIGAEKLCCSAQRAVLTVQADAKTAHAFVHCENRRCRRHAHARTPQSAIRNPQSAIRNPLCAVCSAQCAVLLQCCSAAVKLVVYSAPLIEYTRPDMLVLKSYVAQHSELCSQCRLMQRRRMLSCIVRTGVAGGARMRA